MCAEVPDIAQFAEATLKKSFEGIYWKRSSSLHSEETVCHDFFSGMAVILSSDPLNQVYIYDCGIFFT